MRALLLALALLVGVGSSARVAAQDAPTAQTETREAAAQAIRDAFEKKDVAAFRARCSERFLKLVPLPLEELFARALESMQTTGLPPVEEIARDLRQQGDGRWLLDVPEEAVTEVARARREQDEAGAIAALKLLVSAQTLYLEGDKDQNGKQDYAPDLAALAKLQLIDGQLAAGEKFAYRFVLVTAPDRSRWLATAAPIDSASGGACFAVNQGAEVRESQAPFVADATCAIPEGAPRASRRRVAPRDHEEPFPLEGDSPDAGEPVEPAPGAPKDLLAHVQVGQRWVFDLQGGMQMTWHVTSVEEVGRVRYSMRFALQGKPLDGQSQDGAWVYSGPVVAPPADATTPDMTFGREEYAAGERKLEALKTKVGLMTSWVAVKGDHPTFPGVLEATMSDEVQVKLLRVEGP